MTDNPQNFKEYDQQIANILKDKMTNIKDLPHPSELIGKFVIDSDNGINEIIEAAPSADGDITYVDFKDGFMLISSKTPLFPTRAAAQEYIDGVK